MLKICKSKIWWCLYNIIFLALSSHAGSSPQMCQCVRLATEVAVVCKGCHPNYRCRQWQWGQIHEDVFIRFLTHFFLFSHPQGGNISQSFTLYKPTEKVWFHHTIRESATAYDVWVAVFFWREREKFGGGGAGFEILHKGMLYTVTVVVSFLSKFFAKL